MFFTLISAPKGLYAKDLVSSQLLRHGGTHRQPGLVEGTAHIFEGNVGAAPPACYPLLPRCHEHLVPPSAPHYQNPITGEPGAVGPTHHPLKPLVKNTLTSPKLVM